MKKIYLFAALVVAIAGISGIISCKPSSKSSTTKFLKFNLEKGKGYDYELLWDMKSMINGQETNISMDALYSMNVEEEEGQVRSVSTQYNRIKINMKVMGMSIEMDSEKPAEENADAGGEKNPMTMMNKIMSSIVKKPFIIKVDEEGTVLDVAGFDKIISDMVDSMGLDEDIKQQAMASMKDQFSNQTIKDQFAQVFTIFPNKEIKVGDSWVKSYSTVGKLKAKFTTTFTVKEIDGDHVSLTSKTKITSSDDDMELEGIQSGNILVDSKTGLTISSDYDQEIEITSDGTKIKMDGKGKIKGKAH